MVGRARSIPSSLYSILLDFHVINLKKCGECRGSSKFSLLFLIYIKMSNEWGTKLHYLLQILNFKEVHCPPFPRRKKFGWQPG